MIVYGHSYDRCARTFVLHGALGTDSTALLSTYPYSEVGPATPDAWLRELKTAVSSIQLSVLEGLSIPVASAEQMGKLVKSFEQEARIKSQIQQLRDEQAILAASFWSL